MIRRLLTTEPTLRITAEGIRNHPWYCQLTVATDCLQPEFFTNGGDTTVRSDTGENEGDGERAKSITIDHKVIEFMVNNGFSERWVLDSVMNTRHDANCAAYWLLVELKKRQGGQLVIQQEGASVSTMLSTAILATSATPPIASVPTPTIASSMNGPQSPANKTPITQTHQSDRSSSDSVTSKMTPRGYDDLSEDEPGDQSEDRLLFNKRRRASIAIPPVAVISTTPTAIATAPTSDKRGCRTPRRRTFVFTDHSGRIYDGGHKSESRKGHSSNSRHRGRSSRRGNSKESSRSKRYGHSHQKSHAHNTTKTTTATKSPSENTGNKKRNIYTNSFSKVSNLPRSALLSELRRVLALNNVSFSSSNSSTLNCQVGPLKFNMVLKRWKRNSGEYVVQFGHVLGEKWIYKELCKRLLDQMKM